MSKVQATEWQVALRFYGAQRVGPAWLFEPRLGVLSMVNAIYIQAIEKRIVCRRQPIGKPNGIVGGINRSADACPPSQRGDIAPPRARHIGKYQYRPPAKA